MKSLWSVLTLVFGVIGLVAVFRVFEVLIWGALISDNAASHCIHCVASRFRVPAQGAQTG